MNRATTNELYRCDLCHRSVDADTRDRARRAWQPLIICERCIRDADSESSGSVQMAATAGQ